jgi:hypothetical protein
VSPAGGDRDLPRFGGGERVGPGARRGSQDLPHLLNFVFKLVVLNKDGW